MRRVNPEGVHSLLTTCLTRFLSLSEFKSPSMLIVLSEMSVVTLLIPSGEVTSVRTMARRAGLRLVTLGVLGREQCRALQTCETVTLTDLLLIT